MCGRYELHSHPAAIALAFGLPTPPTLVPRYNIAPMQPVSVIRQTSTGERQIVEMRWGLVPRWAKDPAIGAKMINARGEGIAEKPAFRWAFERRRCLFPADGFYDWKVVNGGKQPFHVGTIDGQPLGIAGLYERWLSSDGDVLDTCTVITTDANALLRDVHDRMPVIVAPQDYARWLDRSRTDVVDLIAPYRSDALRLTPISTRVNSAKNDDPSLLEPIAQPVADDGPDAVVEATDEPAQESLF